jgi:hypothetical protein
MKLRYLSQPCKTATILFWLCGFCNECRYSFFWVMIFYHELIYRIIFPFRTTLVYSNRHFMLI